MKGIKDLFTPSGEMLINNKAETPWNVYPRPHLQRDSFFCLNGYWDFCFAESRGEADYSERIRVPFVPESLLSEVHKSAENDKLLCYRRTFSLPDGFVRSRVILHIDGCDGECNVYLNGSLIGSHIGGYDPFSFDITDFLQQTNVLEITAYDKAGQTVLPYGKQKKKRGGMWYTNASGIWQSVWIESVSDNYVREISVRTDMHRADITVTPALDGKITLDDGEVFLISNGRAVVEPKNPKLWTPESPNLYHFTAECNEDTFSSYFALREISTGKVNGISRLLLNGEPYFFHGLLDQGYFSDGIFTPASPEDYENDILCAKKFGFNMLRKHIKAEPELFYYYCDKHGMAVFQDMINNGRYSFIRDTALPTVGIKRLNDKKLHRNQAQRAAFLDSMKKTVGRLSFHPAVLYWTIFNEGWGQFDHKAAYKLLRELDNTRIIDSVSGWFEPFFKKNFNSDVKSLHIYFKPVKIKPSNKPIILSEFGGYSQKIKEHSFNLTQNYGYKTFTNKQQLNKALKDLYLDQVLPAIKSGLCASVYTQLSDVEDETNGIITYDRRVEKLDPELMRKIASALRAETNGLQDDCKA